MNLKEQVSFAIRDVPDFPKPGIVFKDITPIMHDASLCRDITQHLVDFYADFDLQGIAGIESRGFLFGFPLAMALGIPFILIRKKGKLPFDKISHSYELEYGSAVIEMHSDAIKPGDNILIHDDLLATGGSACAAAELITKCGGTIAGFDFLISLSFLNGKAMLSNYSQQINSIVQYP